jgi:hypothetical protein
MANFPLGVEHLRFVTIRWATSPGHKICRNAAGAIGDQAPLDLIAPKEEPFPQGLHPLPGEHGLDVSAQLSSQISGFETICLRAGAEAQARAVPFSR